MLAESKASDDKAVFAPLTKLEKAASKLRAHLDTLPLNLYPDRDQVPYAVQWVPGNLRKKIDAWDPDIVNLHWICNGYVNIEAIGRFDRPIVWSLHDMWPFTGGCHYDQGCERYAQSCGACPQLHSWRERDLSHWTWWRKRKAWRNADLTIVALSRWLAKCARKSSLFRDLRIEVISNGLDVARFKPVDKHVAREVLNLPFDKDLVLFSAMSAVSDLRKGFDLLESALHHLRDSTHQLKMDVVVFGASEPSLPVDLGFASHYLGVLRDEISVSLAYAAADAFVAPSRQDNLPNTVVESLACGTPCVAFDIGGMLDMIDHKRNGYLAEPFDVEDFARGIAWILEDEERRQRLSQNARQKAVREFDQELQARRYLSLFEDILARR